MYQTLICIILLGASVICGIIIAIQQKLYMNWLMHGDYKKDWRKDYKD